jgi:sodium/bile acid cotransporter 7
MMAGLVLVLVLPLGVGQSLRAVSRLRTIAIRHKSVIGIVSQLLVLIIMLKAAVDVNRRLGMETTPLSAFALLGAAVLCVSNHLAAFLTGFWGSRALGFDRPSQIGVAFGCSQKTLPVALFLFDSYFRDYPLAIVPLVFYHVGQLVMDTFIAEEMIKHSSPKSLRSLP